MWGWEIQLEERNIVIISQRAIMVATMHLAVRTLAKKKQKKTQLQMVKTNDFDKDGYRTFIVQSPYRKKKTFLFVQIISEKIAPNETLRWDILYLFPCSSNP